MKASFLTVLARRICMAIPFLRPLIGMPLYSVWIRHAESLQNIKLAGRLYFDTPEELEMYAPADHKVPITDDGYCMSVRIGPLIRKEFGVPDGFVDSGYDRPIATRKGILEGGYKDVPLKQIDIYSDLRFRERERGYTHFMLGSQVVETYPFMQPIWKRWGPLFARPQGGESLQEMIEGRLASGVTDVYRRFAGKRVVFIACHGRVIQGEYIRRKNMTVAEAEQFLSDSKNNPSNCSITVYKYCPKKGDMVPVSYARKLCA